MERMLNNAQNALVIGGGFIGLETVEQIRNRGVQCTLVELSDQVMLNRLSQGERNVIDKPNKNV